VKIHPFLKLANESIGSAPLAQAGHIVYAGYLGHQVAIPNPFEESTRASTKRNSVVLGGSPTLMFCRRRATPAVVDTSMRAALEGWVGMLMCNARHMAFGPAEVPTTRQYKSVFNYAMKHVGTQRTSTRSSFPPHCGNFSAGTCLCGCHRVPLLGLNSPLCF
jgi:hypothetical protein